ncbi:PH domain-containing protein [uncultured Methanobrevibacter sp.]|uniref:PH domain-containing protein n=1 Tax=uncultured Methanobrevibacter sp. TaxID=253161 RepID=UPI00260D98D9|nr:PH domain-containing protein [uncultured Methanobrevibacter sp.]
MLFSKNDERANERVLYKTKPNMILGCKKAIYGVVLLAVAFVVSPMAIQFIGRMQVYLISQIQLPLTRYAAIAFFVVILAIILYIIWQLLRWFSIEYTLTDSRIIIKSGLLSTKKNYMPYSTIQDINTSQSIFARMFNVGTLSAFSAYDNNQIKLENISNPSEVEEIIFSNMLGYRNFQEPPRNFINRPQNNPRHVETQNNEYYDEYEPITPIGHERNDYQRREYEYYPDEFSFQESRINKYEYEPYGDDLDYNVERVMNTSRDNIIYEGSSNDFSNDGYYNEVRDNYSRNDRDYYQDNERQYYNNDIDDKNYQNEQNQVDETDDSSEKVIRRHFDKFKR